MKALPSNLVLSGGVYTAAPAGTASDGTGALRLSPLIGKPGSPFGCVGMEIPVLLPAVPLVKKEPVLLSGEDAALMLGAPYIAGVEVAIGCGVDDAELPTASFWTLTTAEAEDEGAGEDVIGPYPSTVTHSMTQSPSFWRSLRDTARTLEAHIVRIVNVFIPAGSVDIRSLRVCSNESVSDLGTA